MIKVINNPTEGIRALDAKETFVYISTFPIKGEDPRSFFLEGAEHSHGKTFAKGFWDHYKGTPEETEAMAYLLGCKDV